ncbi:MAG: TonB-dependent receptor [Myxococcota bacterium]
MPNRRQHSPHLQGRKIRVSSRRLPPLWSLLGTSLLLSQPLHAATLEGNVKFSTMANLLSEARVQLRPLEPTGPVRTVQTKGEGYYLFEQLMPGTYQLEVSHPLYNTRVLKVTLDDANTRVQLPVMLDKIQLATLPVIEVDGRANTPESPAAFSNLPRQVLEEKGQVQDIPHLLAETPSIHVFNESGMGLGYSYLTLRGFDQRRVSVMIDGVPQNDPEDHNVYWINVYDITGALEDIQVQRGAGAGFYGPPAIGGSIHLVTRQLSIDPYVKVSLGTGTFLEVLPEASADTTVFEQSPPCTPSTTHKLGGEVNSGLLAHQFVIYARLSAACSGGYRDWSWSKYLRGALGGAWYGENQSLKLQFFGGPQADALAYYGIPADYNADPLLRRSNYGAPADGRTGDVESFAQYHLTLTYERVISPQLLLKTTAFLMDGSGYFDFDGSWGDPYYFRMDETQFPEYYLNESEPNAQRIPADTMLRAFVHNRQLGLLPRVTWQHPGGELNSGLELRTHRSLHWGRIQQGSFTPEAQATLVGEEADRHYYEYSGGKDVLAPYLNEQLRLGPLKVEGNLQLVAQRYVFFDEAYVGQTFEVPYLFVNPRVGASWQVQEQFQIFASLSRVSREPRLKELYDAENASYGYTPQLDGVRPERLTDLELGGRVQLNRLRASLNLFSMDFEDEIVKTGGLDQFGQPYYGNAALTRHLGAELEAAATLLPNLTVSGHLSYNHNRFIRFDEYLDDGRRLSRDGNPIAGAPDWLGGLQASYRISDFQLGIESRGVGKQYVDNSGDTLEDGRPAYGALTVKPYQVVNGRALWRPSKGSLRGTTVGLELQNLLNAQVLTAGEGADNFFPLAPRALFLNVQVEQRPH